MLWIGTANCVDAMSPPLRDRMDVIEVSGYTDDEKVAIVKCHLETVTARSGNAGPTAGFRARVLMPAIRIGVCFHAGSRTTRSDPFPRRFPPGRLAGVAFQPVDCGPAFRLARKGFPYGRSRQSSEGP